MKLYDARVRLGGSVANEVNKTMLTAPEVLVLQRIHGADAVLDIEEIGSVNRSDRKERARLAGIYSVGPSADRKDRIHGEQFIDSVFGVNSVPLPQEYVAPAKDDADEEVFLAEDEDEVIEIKRTKVAKPAPKVKPTAKPAEDVASLTA